MKHNHSRLHGQWGEMLARFWFRLHGYCILYQNYVTGRGSTAGEVDFIAKRGNTIVFVEVKLRQNLENALYAIKPHQQKRIINAAHYFIQKHPQYNGFNLRFDAVCIKFPFQLKHFENAWSSF